MSVMIVTSLGDIIVDLYTDRCPLTTKNFLKLCKMKYYNGCLFHTVEKGFIAQSGDRTGTGNGGDSVYKFLYGDQARFFNDEIHPDLKHSKIGTFAMASAGENCNASQFYITLRDDIEYLDGKHTVFGIVEEKESLDSLAIINEAFVDSKGRPFKDIRIKHTYILDDPFDDPSQLAEFIPEKSPEGNPPEEVAEERLEDSWVPMDEKLSVEELEEVIRSKEAHTNAVILESIGDIPDADLKPPDTVLFVCKLNPVTQDEDLFTIFSRFGTVTSADIIRDYKTEASLCYAFIEFESKEDCERAYFKMDNALIDDRRIRVDFSQSVAKLWKHFRHGKKSSKAGCFKCGAADHIARDCIDGSDDKQESQRYVLKDSNTQRGGDHHKSYDMLFEEDNVDDTSQKLAKKIKTSHHKFENSRDADPDDKSSGRNKHEEDQSKRHRQRSDVRDDKKSGSSRGSKDDIYRKGEETRDDADPDDKSSGRNKHEEDQSRRHRQRSDVRDDKSGSNRGSKDDIYRKGEGTKDADPDDKSSSRNKHEEDQSRHHWQRSDVRDDKKSGSSRGNKDDIYRKGEGTHGKKRAEAERHHRDYRPYERSRDRSDESHGERRHRDGRR